MGLLERSWDVKTRIPNSLLQLSPVTQLELKQDKVKYEPKLAAPNTDAYESSASLERRMPEFNLRELQNEPKSSLTHEPERPGT